MTLQSKLILICVCLFIVPVVLVALVLYSLSIESVTDFALLSERQELRFRADSFEESVDSWKAALTTLSLVPEVQDIIDGKETGGSFLSVAEQTMRLQQDIRNIRVIDAKGKETFRLERKRGELKQHHETLQNKSHRRYFKEAVIKPAGRIYVSRVNLNREDGKIEQPAWPTVRLATAVADQGGENVGIIVVNIDFSRMLVELSHAHGTDASLVTESGMFIIEATGSRTFQESESLKDRMPEVWAIMNESHDPGHFFYDYGHYVWVQLFIGSADDPLFLVSRIRGDYLYSALEDTAKIFAIVVLSIVILVIILSFFVVDTIVGPLNQVARGARIIGAGNLKHRVKEVGGVELAKLARSVNEMAANLEASLTKRDNLNEEIEKRTCVQKDLERSQVALLNILEDFKTQRDLLSVSEERFHVALDASPIAIMMVDEEGVLSFVNHECSYLFGYTKRELQGQKIEKLLPERYHARHPEMRDSFFRAPVRRAMGEGRDLFARKKDGTEMPVEVGLNPVSIDGATFVLSSVIDLSERIKSEEALRFYNEELEQLVYSVSHDLKAPMVTIQGFSEVMQESLENNELDDAIDAAKRVVRAGKTMDRTIQDLVSLNRLTRQEVTTERIVIDELIGDILASIDADLQQRQIQIRKDLQLTECIGDRRRVEQGFLNLIVNAVKYGCPDDGATIWIGALQERGIAKFYVRDEGPGVPSEFQKSIFELFKKVDRGSEGTGLGLAIVSRCARGMGGDAWVESVKGKGATFWFTSRLEETEVFTEAEAL